MSNYIKYIVGGIIAFYVLVNCVSPPTVNEDTACGLLCLKNMLNGGSFNSIAVSNASNIAFDKEVFVAAWTPLSYLLTAPLVYVGLSIKNACLLINLLSLIVGCVGIYKLLLYFKLSPRIAWITLLVVITCRSNFNTNYYNILLAETLVFATLPWFVLASIYLSNKDNEDNFIRKCITFAILCFVMIMIKLTMIVACIAMVVYIVIDGVKHRQLRNAGVMTLALAVALIGFKYLYQSKGLDTSVLKGGVYVHTKYENVCVASASPIASLLNLTDLEDDKLPAQIKNTFITNKPIILLLLSVVVMLLLYFYSKQMQAQHLAYMQLVLCFYAVYSVVFFYFAMNENAIDFNYRHFRFVAILFIPIFIMLIDALPTTYIRAIFYTGIALLVTYGLATFSYKKLIINKLNPVARTGFAMNYTDAAALNYLHHIDDSLRTGNNLIMVTNPELGLEIKHNRQMVSLQYYSSGLNYGWLQPHYYGSVDNLYVFAEKLFLNTSNQEQMLSTLFQNYTLQPIKTFDKIIVYKGIKK